MALISDVLSDAMLDQLNQASMEWPTKPSVPTETSNATTGRRLSKFHGVGKVNPPLILDDTRNKTFYGNPKTWGGDFSFIDASQGRYDPVPPTYIDPLKNMNVGYNPKNVSSGNDVLPQDPVTINKNPKVAGENVHGIIDGLNYGTGSTPDMSNRSVNVSQGATPGALKPGGVYKESLNVDWGDFKPQGRKLKKIPEKGRVAQGYKESELSTIEERQKFFDQYRLIDEKYDSRHAELSEVFGIGPDSEMSKQFKAREDAMRKAFIKDLGGIEKTYGTNSFAALKQMNSAYGLGVDPEHLGFKARASNMAYKASGGRIGSNTYSEALARIRQAYNMKLEQFVNEARPGKTMMANTGAIENDVMRRNWMSMRGKITKPPPGAAATEKSGGKSILKGAGGKIAAVAGLLTLGGVIGNMLSGGHRSNAELYNPNGYQQYYS